MNILVCGAGGQLSSEIALISKEQKHNFIFKTFKELDICDNVKVDLCVQNNNIHIIINCAAYNNVEGAESEPNVAMEVNSVGPHNLATVSKKHNVLLVHISTDFVFDGKSSVAYLETDIPNPLNIYAKSKLSGENFVVSSDCKYLIIRTSWLYSSFNSNFVKTILKFAKQREFLTVIDNQFGTPTNAKDLAKVILEVIFSPNLSVNNIYHYSNDGVISWYEFAKAIVEFGKIECDVRPINSKDYPSKVERPQFSVLNKSKIVDHYNISIPNWKESLKEFFLINRGSLK